MMSGDARDEDQSGNELRIGLNDPEE